MSKKQDKRRRREILRKMNAPGMTFGQVDTLHDDRCAWRKGHPCNCAMAALKRVAR